MAEDERSGQNRRIIRLKPLDGWDDAHSHTEETTVYGDATSSIDKSSNTELGLRVETESDRKSMQTVVGGKMIPRPETRLQPVLKLYDIMIDYQTTESYVIEEENIKCEPVDDDWSENNVVGSSIKRKGGSIPLEDAPPAPVTPPHSFLLVEQNLETWAVGDKIVKQEPTDVVQITTEAEDGSCMDEDRTLSDEPFNAVKSNQKSCRTTEEVSGFNALKLSLAQDTGGKLSQCKLCAFDTPHAHVPGRHTGGHAGENITCTKSDSELNRQSRQKLDSIASTHGGRKFHCELCDFKSRWKCDLRNHLRIHTDESFNCEHCGYKSNYKRCLRDHMRIHTGETFNCEFCEYKSNYKSGLRDHMRIHTGETFNCAHCDYKSNYKSKLLAHLRKHTGQTLNCEHCDYKSVFKSDLLNHMRIHTDEAFNCKICAYKTRFKGNLIVHMRKHTGDTFNCEHCNYKSNYKSSLHNHMKKHTGETFDCEHCEYTTNARSNLSIHIHRHHPEHGP